MKNILWSIVLLLPLAACQTMTFDEEEINPTEQNEAEEKGTKEMHFHCAGFKSTYLEETEDATKASSTQEYTDHIILAIYDKDGNQVGNAIKQDKGDPNITYGTFSYTLEYGKYTILAIGWNGEQQCLITSLENISFSENWVPQMFICRQNIVVSESYSNQRTMTLKRCVATWVLNCTDKNIPKEASVFKFHFTNAGNTLNSETLYCPQTQDFEREVVSEGNLTSPLKITAHCFLPQESGTINVKVSVYDKSGNIIAEREITDIPMRINCRTISSGNLFPIGEANGNVAFETEYAEDINHSF